MVLYGSSGGDGDFVVVFLGVVIDGGDILCCYWRCLCTCSRGDGMVFCCGGGDLERHKNIKVHHKRRRRRRKRMKAIKENR